METNNKKFIERIRIQIIVLMFLDVIIINFSYLFALWIRFDCSYSRIPAPYLDAWVKCIPVYSIVTIAIYWFCKMYKSLWRYASYNELRYIIRSSLASNIFYILYITYGHQRMPFAYYVLGWMVQIGLITMLRFSYRLFVLIMKGRSTGSWSSVPGAPAEC